MSKCDSCTYSKLSCDQYPCSECYDASNFVSKIKKTNPFQSVLPKDQENFLASNEYELKYLPVYANQPDPTYIKTWVWEVRDKHGASVASADELLYTAIDNAMGVGKNNLSALQHENKLLKEKLRVVHDGVKQGLKALEEISNEMTVGERYSNAGQYLIDSLCPMRDALWMLEQ